MFTEYFGYLLKVTHVDRQWNSFAKILLGIERGYELEILQVYVFNDDIKEKLKSFAYGSMICGMMDARRAFLKLQSIELKSFSSCKVCRLVVSDSQCQGCLKPSNKKLTGEWRVLSSAKHPSCDGYKVVLKQDDEFLTFVSFEKSHHFNICKKLYHADNVSIEGWINSQRHVKIRCINKVTEKLVN